MFEFIESVRKKPDGTKKWIAFVISFAFCAVLLIVWISVWYPDWKDGQIAEQKSAESDIAPFSSLGSTFSAGFSQIRDQFSKLKETVSGN